VPRGCGAAFDALPQSRYRSTAPSKREPALRGNPLRRGCPLSLAARDSSPKGGAKAATAGLPSQSRCARQLPQRGSQGRCGGVALSVPLRGTAPPKGEPRPAGDGGCPLRRGCPLSPAARDSSPKGGAKGDARFVGQGFYPCLTPRMEKARAEPLPYGGCVKQNVRKTRRI
jgi:hypothetical protein